ncbi:MAG: protease inhibitor I42 family protein [Pseudomonadota bacterium]
MPKLSAAQYRSWCRHSEALFSALCAGALLIACSKPSPAPVAPASAASLPSEAETAAPPPSSPPPATTATEQVASYDENTKTITAKAGAHFSLLLPANVTTPMKWRIQPTPDAAVLTLAGESYSETPPAGCAGCTGYPGTKRFDFEAHARGKQTLHVSYGSLTDPSAKPEKELRIVVTVE